MSARKLTVKYIEYEIAAEFIRHNHRQGFPKNASKALCLGLFLDEELLGACVFSSVRTSAIQKRYTTELLRLAFKQNARIQGGASKLIKHYVANFKPSDFFTYQDTSGEATSVYEHAGMTLVSQAKRKQYLVAPGKTLATGSRKEVLGMAYAK